MTEACDPIKLEKSFVPKNTETWEPEFRRLKRKLQDAIEDPEKPVILLMTEFSKKIHDSDWNRTSRNELSFSIERPLGLNKSQLDDFIAMAQEKMGVTITGEISEALSRQDIDLVLLRVTINYPKKK